MLDSNAYKFVHTPELIGLSVPHLGLSFEPQQDPLGALDPVRYGISFVPAPSVSAAPLAR